MADRPDRGSTAGTPRWVVVSAIVALALVLVIVVLILTGTGNHGPSRHLSGGNDVGPPPFGFTEHGVQQP